MVKLSDRVQKVILVLSLIILTIVLLGLCVFCFYWNKLDLLQLDTASIDVADPTSLERTVDAINIEEKLAIESEDDIAQIIPSAVIDKLEKVNQEVVAPKQEIKKDKGVLNVLLIGTDESSESFTNIANSDCMIIISIDKGKNTVKLVSIERGTGVPISVGQYAGEYEWINNMVRVGGPGFLTYTVQEVFRVDLMGYIRVNPYTFVKIVEACGGAEINLTQAEADYINKYSRYKKVIAGSNLLDGKTTELYARCRAIDDDWSRIGRQRTVIQAAITQSKDMSFGEINDMFNMVLPYIQTNLTKPQITELILQVPSIAGKTAKQLTIPKAGTYSIMQNKFGKNMFSVDFDTNAKELHEFLYN